MNTYLIKSLLSYNDISSSTIDLKMYNILICGYFIVKIIFKRTTM